MRDLFDEFIPQTPREILENAPMLPCTDTGVLLAFSGGNDSRCLAHVCKELLKATPFQLELAAIETGLQMEGWKQSVIEFAELIDLPVSFWQGEGRDFYKAEVAEYGFPGNPKHGKVQSRLKGRAYEKMFMSRRTNTPKPMMDAGVSVWILSGIRKKESRKRELLTSPYSGRNGVLFINPLFYWDNAQVVDYMIKHNIPFSPFKQGDCKCGATVDDADSEWRDIEKNSPELCRFLNNLENPFPWGWGKFNKSAWAVVQQIKAGQQWFDDGSIASFPTCLNCERGLHADEESAMREW